MIQEMLKAKKAMKSRVLRDAAEDDEEEEEEAPARAAGWGGRKDSYYDDGDYEVRNARLPASRQPRLAPRRLPSCASSPPPASQKDSDSEEAAAEEEKEALRLQREAAASLRAEDFDQVRAAALSPGCSPGRARRLQPLTPLPGRV